MIFTSAERKSFVVFSCFYFLFFNLSKHKIKYFRFFRFINL
jgi:hypothetical protein